jgi:hypothetical protein
LPVCLSLLPCDNSFPPCLPPSSALPPPSSCPPASVNDCLHTWPPAYLYVPASAYPCPSVWLPVSQPFSSYLCLPASVCIPASACLWPSLPIGLSCLPLNLPTTASAYLHAFQHTCLAPCHLFLTSYLLIAWICPSTCMTPSG